VTRAQRNNLLQRAAEIIGSAATIAGVIAVIATAFWWLAKDKAKAEFQDFVEIDTLTTSINRQTVAVRDLGVRVASVEQKVTALEPPQRVAEYDALRSEIIGPCVVGETCEYIMRVRRTDWGKSCGRPVVLYRIVVDRGGLQHPVNTLDRPVTRLGSEWTVIKGTFSIPLDAQTGVAEFFMVLEYAECGGEADPLEERTIKLPFEIVEPAP